MNAHNTHIEDLADRIKPRTASNILLWIVGIFFVAFFAWASLTKLDRTVKGGGRVIASSHMQVLTNLEGGIVQAILVKVGQQVQRGQELLQLDRTASGAELGSGQASINTLSAKIARLSAEITGTNPVYPASADPEVQEQVRIEQSLHASRMAEFSAIVNAGRARIDQATKAVLEAESAYQSKVSAREARQRELGIIRPLVEKGIEPRMSLSDAEAQYAIASSDAAAAAAAISRARAAIAEAQSATRQQQQDWRSLAANELATAQGERSARRSTIPALAEKVARTSVRSPLPGRINRVLVTTVGSAVAPGAPLVEIVPSEETLLVEAMVRPQDIAFVRLGQKARVNVTAYDPSVYGSLHGNVVAIAPDVVINEKSGESFYTVQIRTTSNALKDKDGHPLPIGTGMTADVSLIGDKRTVLQYILTPITRLTETAFRE